MPDAWTLDGTYTEACTCEAICPCIVLSDPTGGSCTALVGWHIQKGKMGGTSLDGLNIALGVHTPGNMKEKDWTAALYVDQRASEPQRQALTQIFGGQAGGHLGRIAQHIAKVAGVHFVPITFETDGRRGTLKVGDVGSSDWEPVEGQGGGDVTVQGNPLAISPGHTAVIGRAKKARFKDHGMSFEASGRQAMVAPFSYAGP
jgi:hypothetical protein